MVERIDRPRIIGGIARADPHEQRRRGIGRIEIGNQDVAEMEGDVAEAIESGIGDHTVEGIVEREGIRSADFDAELIDLLKIADRVRRWCWRRLGSRVATMDRDGEGRRVAGGRAAISTGWQHGRLGNRGGAATGCRDIGNGKFQTGG